MGSEKLIMGEENYSKAGSREGVCELFYQHYCDFLRQWKVVKMNLKNIITSYYQITKVFKLVLNIWQHAGNKDERK